MLKAKQKTVSILLACLTMLAALVLGFVSFFKTPTTTASAETATETLDVYGTTGTLASDSSSISWSSGVVTFTNEKGDTAIRTSDSNHYRAYANSIVVISAGSNMITSVVITCQSSYADECKTSLENAGYTVSVNGSVVTVSVSDGAESITFTSSAQWRLNKLAVTYTIADSGSDCEHVDNGVYTYTPNNDKTHQKNSACTTCEEAISVEEECSFGEGVVNGTTVTYTCEYCNYSYSNFNLTYSYPAGVTFSGAETTVSVEEGTKVTLPNTTAPDGYVFAGWCEENITEVTTTKPTLYTDAYTVTAETTLYAVYHNDVEAGGWNLVTDVDDLATDDIVTIVAPSSNVAIGKQSGNYFSSVAFSTENTSEDVLKLTLTKNSDGTYSFYTGTTYLAYTGSSNTLNTSSTIEKSSSWNVTISDSTTTILNANSTTRNLQYNSNNPRFACYTSTQKAVVIYEYTEGGEISYTSVFCDHSETYTETEEATCTQDGAIITKCSNCNTEISRETIEATGHGETTTVTTDATCTKAGTTTVTCNTCGEVVSIDSILATGHQNTTTTTVDATCTEAGSITVTCNDCGETVSTETIAATGHSLDEGVITTQPQAGVEGEKTYTCQNGCGYTETESIPALDATKYTLSYSVPNGVEAPENEELVLDQTITLPSIEAPVGLTFVGWVTEECNETEVAPETVYKAESEYTLTVEENVTLYALFTYSVGSSKFVKVTEAPADWSGEYLIVAEGDEGNAYVFNSVDAANGYVQATVSDSVIAFSDEVNAEIVTIAAMSGGYSILTKNGYIYGSSSGNKLSFDTSTAQLNTIALADDGSATITSGRVLRFNNASNQMRFRYYTAGSQQAVYLYALELAPTYYSTNCSVNIDSASLTIGQDLTMNYYVTMPDAYANATMHFTMDGETTEVSGVKEANGDRYVFSFAGIPPHYMADAIDAKLYFGDQELASELGYSVKIYAENTLNKSPSAELKQLLIDLLHYGAASQTYQGRTDNLANENVTGEPSAASPTEDDSVYALTSNEAVTEYPAYFTAAGVWFDNVNKLYVKVNATENVTLIVTCNGAAIEHTEFGANVFMTDSIYATEFDAVYTFELYHDGTLMQTLTYSVNSYVYEINANSEDENMKALALALYNYGESAKAYKNVQENV